MWSGCVNAGIPGEGVAVTARDGLIDGVGLAEASVDEA
jgi:hypothetical protein